MLSVCEAWWKEAVSGVTNIFSCSLISIGKHKERNYYSTTFVGSHLDLQKVRPSIMKHFLNHTNACGIFRHFSLFFCIVNIFSLTFPCASSTRHDYKDIWSAVKSSCSFRASRSHKHHFYDSWKCIPVCFEGSQRGQSLKWKWICTGTPVFAT